ncbi:alpha-hydroxy acid oxidase [uncultured Hyphomicrobium sp.]|uniref:alpha-hydroxy acid oxidase n=1 Tax=uncultured Hyphomicrobium sp. TaxID=194373 RepID=UPI0025E641D8|nr:alpha-hydroxy acid oxidase [uncultured Hyphomicrobium sp.]
METGAPSPVSLADYERLAEQRLDANAWAYFAGGSADEITLRWNRESFDRIAVSPRVLNGGPGGHTRLSLLGQRYEHPIFVAPVAYQKLAHADGERATAAAAEAQDACMVLSTQASVSLEDAADAGASCRWFQLYVQPVREATLSLVRRAEAAGYEVLVVTVDAPINGVRNREHRAGFSLPVGIVAENLKDIGGPAVELARGQSAVFDRFMAVAPTWDDIVWLSAETRLPIVVKGILSAEDAVRAADAGVAGIIVSNHGGRTLDTLPATIDVLPGIVSAVAGRVPVLLDGGIRRGTDVLKALALGAQAVLVGRPIIYGLAVNGAYGVAHVLRLLRDELEVAMALSGCRTLADVGPHLVIGGRRG